MQARFLLASVAALSLAACSQGEEAPTALAQNIAVTGVTPADPLPESDRVLLWGDTHVHSRNSVDAFATGLASADIDSAYRFARGIPVVFPKTGQRVQIDRPLDFLVMSDHAENLGISPRIEAGDPRVVDTVLGSRFARILAEQGGAAFSTAMMGFDQAEADRAAYFSEFLTDENRQVSWDAQVAAAERHNFPGTFTAIIGWEWSSTPNTRNLHRIVMTDVDGDVARQFLPFSYYQSDRPEDLWSFFEQTRARTGADFVAMPHNSNLSDGLMFGLEDSDGNPFTAAYAERRSMWEPVVEVSQYKGTSETHPVFSTTDEFANFELRNMLLSGQPTEASQGSYVRGAYLRGLAEAARIGRNPFQFGMIAASDSHTGFASVEEDSFLGKMAEDFRPAERVGPDALAGIFPNVQMSAGGLAGVWADRNDRQSIFAAFRRKEVYGTTGPRMRVRVFAGYGFEAADAARADFADRGYRMGVPMGGTLARSDGRAPRLMIQAAMDPEGANLDRVQVVKGWLAADGTLHEKVFNVAWSGNRRMRADGSLPAVGNTVDLATARYTNTIGKAELATVWTDTDFDPAERAFYYVRVLQIPTPRQHVFDALAMGIDLATIDIPPTIQERAWSSPVWYMP